mmetsp:Transcript_22669/g.59109  ORF Transcript_22669/g.59109 Transcript_22669/m.59109 type:complete len:206 (-) Transcript_22669:181-798(-)
MGLSAVGALAGLGVGSKQPLPGRRSWRHGVLPGGAAPRHLEAASGEEHLDAPVRHALRRGMRPDEGAGVAVGDALDPVLANAVGRELAADGLGAPLGVAVSIGARGRLKSAVRLQGYDERRMFLQQLRHPGDLGPLGGVEVDLAIREGDGAPHGEHRLRYRQVLQALHARRQPLRHAAEPRQPAERRRLADAAANAATNEREGRQ